MASKHRAKKAAKASPEKKGPSREELERAEKKQSFLDKFKDYGTIYHTGIAIGVPHSTINDWLNGDAAFAESFKKIRAIPGYMIERAALERAKNKDCNTADTLRIFMLKNLLPDSYGEVERHEVEVTIKDVLVTQFISIVQQAVPSNCPHCKTNLGLTDKIASELLALSERMTKTGGAGASNSRT